VRTTAENHTTAGRTKKSVKKQSWKFEISKNNDRKITTQQVEQRKAVKSRSWKFKISKNNSRKSHYSRYNKKVCKETVMEV